MSSVRVDGEYDRLVSVFEVRDMRHGSHHSAHVLEEHQESGEQQHSACHDCTDKCAVLELKSICLILLTHVPSLVSENFDHVNAWLTLCEVQVTSAS